MILDMVDSHQTITEDLLKSAVAKWSHWISHSVIGSIVPGAKSALSGIHHRDMNKMKEIQLTSDVIDAVSRVLTNETHHTNVFKVLQTVHQQNVYMKANFRFVVCAYGTLSILRVSHNVIFVAGACLQSSQNPTSTWKIHKKVVVSKRSRMVWCIFESKTPSRNFYKMRLLFLM